jgi:hypothetical protein
MIKYEITVNRDHKQITIRYNLEVERGSPERIASFKVYVDGVNVIKEDASENTKFFGTAFAFAGETKDVDINFALTGNKDFSADGSDVLRAGHSYEDTRFSN